MCVYLGSLHTKESGPDKNGKSRLDSLRQMFSLVDKRGSSPRVLSSYLPSRCCIYLPLSLSLSLLFCVRHLPAYPMHTHTISDFCSFAHETAYFLWNGKVFVLVQSAPGTGLLTLENFPCNVSEDTERKRERE